MIATWDAGGFWVAAMASVLALNQLGKLARRNLGKTNQGC